MSRLLDRLAPWVARICGAVALEQADDAAQETLAQILRDRPALREPAALRRRCAGSLGACASQAGAPAPPAG